MPTLSEIVEYANEYLRIREIEDWSNALNGLQIENSGRVTKIGAAVDVSTRVLTAAARKDIDLLIASRIALARIADCNRRVASTIEARFRKRHRALQRPSAARSASGSRQQRAARFGAWTEIDQALL